MTLLSGAEKNHSDLHHEISLTRRCRYRCFMVPGLNPIIKPIADDGVVDTLLFSEEFPEKPKTAKAVEK